MNAGDQKTIFQVSIPAPRGPEMITVLVTGQKDPRAVVWALEILGGPENLDQTWADITGSDPVPCPLHMADQILQQAFEDAFQDPPPF